MNYGRDDKSIMEWMKVFDELYAVADRERTPEQVWIAIMAHSSSIGEAIRRYAYNDLLRAAAHTFCWVCSYVNKCNQVSGDIFSISDSLCMMVSLKYPRVCGHCEGTPCNCDPAEMDKDPDKAAHYDKLLEVRKGVLASVEGYTIRDWKSCFNKIYGMRIHILTLESIGFHFLEEVGEGAVAVRKLGQLRGILNKPIEGLDRDFLDELATVEGIVANYKLLNGGEPDVTCDDVEMLKWRLVEAKMGMVIETADIFSWFCAMMNKLDSILENSNIQLQSVEEKLVDEYFDENGMPRCPTCKKNRCSCIFYL